MTTERSRHLATYPARLPAGDLARIRPILVRHAVELAIA
jgi:hypothetical protein